MKISEQRLNETRRQQTEAIVARHVRELFKRLPMLAGFWLGTDLKVADLVLDWPASIPGWDPGAVLIQSLVELADSHPEAVQLMRGRTFARTLH